MGKDGEAVTVFAVPVPLFQEVESATLRDELDGEIAEPEGT